MVGDHCSLPTPCCFSSLLTHPSSFDFLKINILARLRFFILYSFLFMRGLAVILFSVLIHPILHFPKTSPHFFRGFVYGYDEIEYQLESEIKQKKVKKNP